MKTDLFREDDIQDLKDKIEELQKSFDKVRKGLFARNTSIEKNSIANEDKWESLSLEVYKLRSQVHTLNLQINGQPECILEIVKDG
jgi:hypothetical protein